VTRTVLAYLDPGSSSMIVQVLLGGLAAIGVTLKLYWRRFLRLIGVRKTIEDEPTNTATGAGTTNATVNGGSQDVADAEPVETTKR
jgi:hypothetical protein